MTTGEFGGTGNSTGADETTKVDQAKEKVTGLAAKARETATSQDVAPAAKRSGAGAVAMGAAAVVVLLWRRQIRRNRSLRDRVTRTAKTRGKAARGQLKAQAKAVKAQAKTQAKAAGKNAKKKAGR